MLRVHEICVKKDKESRVIFSQIQGCVEDVMKKNASSIKYRIEEKDEELHIILGTPISIQTANKFVIAFDQKRMRLIKFCVERKKITDAFQIGYLEIIVS